MISTGKTLGSASRPQMLGANTEYIRHMNPKLALYDSQWLSSIKSYLIKCVSALTVLYIATSSASPCIPSPSGLVLWWDFRDGTANDISGFSNNGTVVGNPTFTSGTVVFNNPVGQQRPTQYIALPNSSSLQELETNSFTVAIRYKSTDTSQRNGVLFANPNRNIAFNYSSGRLPCAYSELWDGQHRVYLPPGHLNCSNTIPTSDGVYHWQIVTVDRSIGLATQYIDVGYLGSESIAEFGPIRFNNFYLGALVDYYYGARETTVDEFCIFNRALSPAEVQMLWFAGDAGMCPDLFATIHISAVDICWSGRLDRIYQVQYTTSPTSTNWFPLGVPVHGNGTNCVTDNLSANEQRFYRVIGVP